MTETKDEETQTDLKKNKKWLYILVAGLVLLMLVFATYFGYIYTKNSQNDTNQISQSENQSAKQIQANTQPELKEVSAENQPKVTANPILDSEPRSIAFEGKIGDLTLLMSLNFKDGEIRGQYRYSSQDEYLQLSGRQENGNLKLEETVYIEKEGMKKTGTFDGVYDGKNYVGKWKNYSKELEFDLKHVFSFTESELEVGFSKECVLNSNIEQHRFYSAQITSLVFSSLANRYYVYVMLNDSPCSGTMGFPRIVYELSENQKLKVIDMLKLDDLGTGGNIELSPKQNNLLVYDGIHGGSCVQFDFFKIYDIKNGNIVFNSGDKVGNITDSALYQKLKKWNSDNEIEYHETYIKNCNSEDEKVTKITKRAKF